MMPKFMLQDGNKNANLEEQFFKEKILIPTKFHLNIIPRDNGMEPNRCYAII